MPAKKKKKEKKEKKNPAFPPDDDVGGWEFFCSPPSDWLSPAGWPTFPGSAAAYVVVLNVRARQSNPPKGLQPIVVCSRLEHDSHQLPCL